MTKKNLIITGVVMVLVFALYVIFIKKDPAEKNLLQKSNALSITQGPQVGVKILKALSTLETLNLDTTLFENDFWKKLRDYGRPLLPQPVGRANPFAPIGAGSQFSTSTPR